jgi:hypothetical protein
MSKTYQVLYSLVTHMVHCWLKCLVLWLDHHHTCIASPWFSMSMIDRHEACICRTKWIHSETCSQTNKLSGLSSLSSASSPEILGLSFKQGPSICHMSMVKFYKLLISTETIPGKWKVNCDFHRSKWKKGSSEVTAGWAVCQEGQVA